MPVPFADWIAIGSFKWKIIEEVFGVIRRPIVSVILSIVILASWCGVAMAQQPAPAEQPFVVVGPPPVEFHPPVIDLGEIRPNRRAHGSAEMHNTGTRWLRIQRLKPDCTCTSARLPSSDMIAPGERVPLEIDYLANGSMGEWKGRVRIWIEGYDLIELHARGFVSMPVRAEPAFINALENQGGPAPTSGEFTVKSNDGRPFRIKSVNGAPPDVVDDNPAHTPRSEHRMRWDFSAYDQRTCVDAAGRRLPAWLVIETDHPDCPVFDVEVRHDCVRRTLQPNELWLVQEKRVMLGALEAGQPIEFEVAGKWRQRNQVGPDGLSLTAASDSPLFAIQLLGVSPTEDGFMCRVRLTPAADHRGLMQGSFRLNSSQQSSQVLVVGAVK